jgi:hypothetical protein
VFRATQSIFIKLSWRGSKIFASSGTWAYRIGSLMNFSHVLFFILVAGHAQPEDLFQPSLHCKLHCIAENEYKIMSDCITHIFHYMQVNGFYQALLPL